ncbi:MAG TPA: methionine--tRNA ligase subunit beta, partial [Candidatus Kapabacteria bacterium]|nr:methionine--tRNA ligase subunit beta [Candidatus Kapabacteria bacterium]
QKKLEKWIEEKAKAGWREMVVQQTRSWLKSGLQDRPITRDLDWGVPVPVEGADGKVLYVWFDAPIGYITATKEYLPDSWQNWWRDDRDLDWVCFLGKDNIVFHTIMFPAMLMAYNEAGAGFTYKLPTNVPANEFMNLEGRKLSKSKGWTIEPHEILSRYDADLIRYAIACNLPESKDSDFSWKDFQAHCNNELADILGNFANRVLTFVKNNFDGKVPDVEPDAAFLSEYDDLALSLANCYEHFDLREATSLSLDFGRKANKYFNDNAPWKLVKTNQTDAACVIRTCLEAIRAMSVYLAPLLPNTCAKLAAMLSIPAPTDWNNVLHERLEANNPLGDISILFTKLEDSQMAEELLRMQEMAAKADKPVSVAPIVPELITIDDFKKIKLRTAKVLEAERVPKSKKLLRLQIEIGEEKRQIVAGIAEKYSPEELVGKTIVVVANLQPAKLMGIESNGMLLAVNDEKGPVMVIDASNVASGLEVR